MSVIVNLGPLIRQQFNYNGAPIANGKLFTYAAGTTNKQTSYTDSTGGTPNTNPVILDENGQCDLWLDPTLSYKFVLSPSTDTDPPTNPFWTRDNVISDLSIGGQFYPKFYATAPSSNVGPLIYALDRQQFLLWQTIGTFTGYASPVSAFMRGYISGLTLANNTTNPNTQVDFAPGVACDSSHSWMMNLPSTFTKTLQSSGAWAAGSGGNGLFLGAVAASTWYHCFVIYDPATNAVDCGFDTSITAANIPAGWTAYRRVGSILTDGSANIRAFTQVNDEFLWRIPTLDVNVTGVANGTNLYVVTIPPGLVVDAILQGLVSNSSGSGSFSFNRPGNNDVTGGNAPTIVSQSANVAVGIGRTVVPSNTSQQIQANNNVAGSTYKLSAYGWVDARGRNA